MNETSESLDETSESLGGAAPVLDRATVGKILGVRAKTVSQYLTESRPGGRYEQHPFPAPSGYIGRSPWWACERVDEIRYWDAARPGRGVGGGRPRKVE